MLRRRSTRVTLVFLGFLAAVVLRLWWMNRLERSQDAPIRAAARRYNIDPALVKAVVWQESRFNPNVRGRAKEIGLMQIREDAAQEWADAEHIVPFAHEHCLNPLTNTMAGAWYLKKLLKRYRQTDDPVPFALADYNAGRGNVLKWSTNAASTNGIAFIGQIAFPGTKAYVASVRERYERYRNRF